MNNEVGGKPILMSPKMTPMGGTDTNSTKPGSGAVNAATKYRVDNSYYNLAGAPTLGKPMGGVETDTSTYMPRALSNAGAPNKKPGTSSARN